MPKKSRGRPIAPWTEKLMEFLADGKYHSYTEAIRVTMDAIPPSRALNDTHSSRRTDDISSQIVTGARNVAGNVMRTRKFEVIDKNKKEVTSYKQDRIHEYRVRLRSEEEIKEYMKRDGAPLNKYNEARLAADIKNISSERALGLKSLAAVIAVFDRKLGKPAKDVKIALDLKKAVPVFRGKKGPSPQTLTTGYAINGPGSVWTVFAVWPELKPAITYPDTRQLVRDGWKPITKER